MREKALDRDLALALRRLQAEPGQVRSDGVIQAELALVAQLQDRDRGEELGDRADAVERLRVRGSPACDVGVPKPPLQSVSSLWTTAAEIPGMRA